VKSRIAIELSQRFVSLSWLCFAVGFCDSKSEKRMVIAEQMKCGKNFFRILDYGKMMAKKPLIS